MLAGNGQRPEPAPHPEPEALAAILTRIQTHLPPGRATDDREQIRYHVDQFAHAFSDQASLQSSVTRAYRLYERSGRSVASFITAMHQAAGAVKERQGARSPVKNQMSYFFACLADTLGLQAGDSGDPSQ